MKRAGGAPWQTLSVTRDILHHGPHEANVAPQLAAPKPKQARPSPCLESHHAPPHNHAANER